MEFNFGIFGELANFEVQNEKFSWKNDFSQISSESSLDTSGMLRTSKNMILDEINMPELTKNKELKN